MLRIRMFTAVVALFAALAALLGACQTAPAKINEVTFTAADFSFSGPDSIPAGLANVTIKNDGAELHHLQLLKLDTGKTAQDFIAELESGATALPAWAKEYGGPNAPPPGGSASAIVNLEAGNYLLICFIPSADGVPHVAKVMLKPLTVTAASGAAASEPQADVTLDLVDFGFNFSMAIKPGTHTIRINNVGAQPHEVFIAKLMPGKTAEDVINDTGSNPPPGIPMGGATVMHVGQHMFVTATFEAGSRYALFCFATDPASGAPHFALGMVQEFSVEN